MSRKNERKCQWCKEYAPIEETVFEEVGKNKSKKYYHKDCYEEYLKDKEFKRREREELDGLVEIIKRIYNVKTLPSSVYPYLQDLRNGTQFFGKRNYQYKKGYPYSVIAETYEYCEDTIAYWNSVKNFDGFMSAFRYGLAIVCDKLPIIEGKRKQQEQTKEIIENYVNNLNENDVVFETSYKPKERNNDITEFLDD